jgi:hypothetical protein
VPHGKEIKIQLRLGTGGKETVDVEMKQLHYGPHGLGID